MKLKIIKNKNLSKEYQELININRVKEFGKNAKRDFSKDYEPQTIWFFVIERDKIVSLGGIRPIKINYLGKEYDIKGICSIISVIKGKGYGKILIQKIIKYLKKTGKTGLGFTGKTDFFKKVGLGTNKDFIKRFIYKNPQTGKEITDNDGDGIYYEGKDKIISKILKSKLPVYLDVEHY